jgi:hypothetical protein
MQPETATRLAQAGITREASFTYTEAIQTTSTVLNQALENAR